MKLRRGRRERQETAGQGECEETTAPPAALDALQEGQRYLPSHGCNTHL